MDLSIKRTILFYLFIITITISYAQPIVGTTGLLHAPSAEMQKDKTFIIGGNILHIVPLKYFHYDEIKYTFNYYINITFFPWLEVGYTCTLNYAENGSSYFPPQSWGKYTNQDRRWWREWTPQIVIGLDDPTSHNYYGGGNVKFDGSGMNNYFTRYYLAATKHFNIKNIGDLGTHVSWVTGKPVHRKHYSGISVGLNFRFNRRTYNFTDRVLNGLSLITEYDAITFNYGCQYSIWKDRINFFTVLNDGKYFSGGLFFKIHIK